MAYWTKKDRLARNFRWSQPSLVKKGLAGPVHHASQAAGRARRGTLWCYHLEATNGSAAAASEASKKVKLI
jgi:hypothetical protein